MPAGGSSRFRLLVLLGSLAMIGVGLAVRLGADLLVLADDDVLRVRKQDHRREDEHRDQRGIACVIDPDPAGVAAGDRCVFLQHRAHDHRRQVAARAGVDDE